ncbi:MAG: hypothetical protein J6T87_07525 [Bacteroidales bacterium]|nr:hypothetical protein [Bacteroidales bacterium]
MEKSDLEVTRMSHFVGIGLVLGFLLPHSSIALYLVNPLICVFYQLFKQNRVYYKWSWLVLVPILITLFINLPQGVETKSLLICFTLMLYFACFPIVGGVKIPNGYFYFILVFILLTQVAYAFNISFVERILDTFYPIMESDTEAIYNQRAVNASNIYDFRLGGLYHNGNDCSRFLTFLLAAYLILNSMKPFVKHIPFVAMSFYGVLLTGSRTGFVVASLFVVAYLFVDKRTSVTWKVIMMLVAVVGFAFLTLMGSNVFRGVNVVKGFSDSANYKMDTFGYYLSTENSAVRLLLGYLDSTRFDKSEAITHVMSKFDSDYGGIIFCYGFIGFASILLFFFTVFKRMRSEGRLFFVLLLWMYSSTIIQSYRAVFLFMLLLSVIYNNYNKQAIIS